jgi:uncharacterized membrane protein YgcG
MRPRPWHLPLLAAFLALQTGCATQPGPALPDPALVAAHEWDHGPPWGPGEEPWVAPPTYYYDPDPWYWGGPAVGLGVGIGVGRGHWWGGHRGFGRGGWHGGGGGHFRGGGGRGGGGRGGGHR